MSVAATASHFPQRATHPVFGHYPSVLVASVDTSTQATKVLGVDADEGRVVASGRAAHEVTGTGGARDTDPEVRWRALSHALAGTGRAAEVRAIAAAGQQHGPAILWKETHPGAEARELTDAPGGAGAWAERVGVGPLERIRATRDATLALHKG